MTHDKEVMTVYPHELGGYAVRPINWAGIFDDQGRLAQKCGITALFGTEQDADEYCRICNDLTAFSLLSLREELLKHGETWDAFVASIASALKDHVLPFEPEEELAEKIMHRVVGEEDDARHLGTECSGTISVKNTDGLQKLIEESKKAMRIVDITGYPAKVILQVLAAFDDDIETLVTTEREHYEMLKRLKGFAYYPDRVDDEMLFGKILKFDEKHENPAATIGFKKPGED